MKICRNCGKEYLGRGQFYCSRYCRNHSTERNIKISKNNARGFLGRKHTKETLEKISKANKAKPFSNETRIKMSLAHKGEKSSNWKGGITPLNKKIRHSIEYKLWREAVFKRDNWTCVWCGKRGVTIHADHIKQFAYFSELRFAIDNGRTLCVPCHETTISYKRK